MYERDEFDDDELPPEFEAALAQVARELLACSDGDEIAARFSRYVDDPCAFFELELGVKPWESIDPTKTGQGDVLRAVAAHDRVAVKSGHKVSKSLSAAGLALWWVCTRVGARAVITAPTFNQVKGIIWRELRARYRARDLAEKLQAELPLDPSTGLQLPNGNEILGLSTKTQENLAGISAPNLFFILDEASGYPDDLFEVILGNSAGGAKILAISNPTRTSGWFFKLYRTRAPGWVLLTISSENTPNVVSGKRLIPGLATREWVLEMRAACGPNYEEDATYMVRVRGEFPPQGTDAVIGVRHVERAVAKWKPEPPAAHEGELTLGVDVGRYGGDPSVIQPVRALYAFDPVELSGADGNAVAALVIDVAMGMRQGHELVRVNVDGIGVGSSVVDALKLCDPVQRGWMYIVDMNVGESADGEVVDASGSEGVRTHYFNLRSQLWFGCAEWFKDGGAIPDHARLQTELLAATYTFDLRNRKKVEAKDKMRATLGHSPDYADALCLATYRGSRGTWTKVEYEAAADPRHPPPKARPTLNDTWDDDDDDDGGPVGSVL